MSGNNVGSRRVSGTRPLKCHYRAAEISWPAARGGGERISPTIRACAAAELESRVSRPSVASGCAVMSPSPRKPNIRQSFLVELICNAASWTVPAGRVYCRGGNGRCGFFALQERDWWYARCRQPRQSGRQSRRRPDRMYADNGAGIPLLSIYGAGGGFDQGLANAAGLVGEGFRISLHRASGICGHPFRRTPLQPPRLPSRGSKLDADRGPTLGTSAAMANTTRVVLDGQHNGSVAA